MQISYLQLYQILAVVFGLSPFVWEAILRPRLWRYLDQMTLVNAWKQPQLFLSKLYHNHLIITGLLFGLSGFFAILSFFS